MVRLRLDGPEKNRVQIDRALADAERLLKDPSVFGETRGWHERGLVLLAEMTAVGVYARAINKEQKLQPYQVAEFPEWLKKIINDWHKD